MRRGRPADTADDRWGSGDVPATDHVFLTRFNLPSRGVEGMIRAREGWLHERIELFARYTVPSIQAQTVKPTWLVYLDPESPAWLQERLAPWVGEGLFRPVLRARVSREELLADIHDAVPDPGEFLVTTNVDNDDGVATDLSATLRSVRDDRPRLAVYATRGLIRSPDALFLRHDRRNAFCSVRESWNQPVTAWSEYHNELGRVMPVMELDGPPAWLQVVHAHNVSNRVRGRLVSPTAHYDRFPGLLDDLPTPGAADLARDRWVRRPGREARDGMRSAARVAGLRLMGKERYDRAKVRLSVAMGRGR